MKLTRQKLSELQVTDLLISKIEATNFEQAKEDILPFIKDSDAIKLWSSEFFKDLISKLRVV